MNRRALLKAIAAIPFVGRLFREKPSEPPDLSRFASKTSSFFVGPSAPSTEAYDRDNPRNPYALPDRCPLCDVEWHMRRLPFDPQAWDTTPIREPCHHPNLTAGELYERDIYVQQLRRHRLAEFAVVELSDKHAYKIADIDRVLDFLGETRW